jgi:uncharacterized phage protein (TIGR02220 family)
MATKQVNLRLHPSLIERFEVMAEEHDRPRTYFMVKALDAYLEGLEKTKEPAKKEVSVVKEPARQDGADEVIEYLNLRAGTKYRKTDSNRNLIMPRVREYSVGDCKIVIDKKCAEWLGGEFSKYLRPSTLFNATKFQSYLNQPMVLSKDILKQQQIDRLSMGVGEVFEHE